MLIATGYWPRGAVWNIFKVMTVNFLGCQLLNKMNKSTVALPTSLQSAARTPRRSPLVGSLSKVVTNIEGIA